MSRADRRADSTVWVAAVGAPPHQLRDDVLKALRAEGLTADLYSGSARGVGVVLFDEVSSQLCRFVHEHSGCEGQCGLTLAASLAGRSDRG
jgi:hypothetical protein